MYNSSSCVLSGVKKDFNSYLLTTIYNIDLIKPYFYNDFKGIPKSASNLSPYIIIVPFAFYCDSMLNEGKLFWLNN